MISIVLIEDNLQNARLISKILTSHGYEVTHASDALTGIWYVENIRPDLVLLDMDLPDLSGDVVAQRLNHSASTCHIPIVVVTANTSLDIQRLAIINGCQEVITKPIDTRQFPQQVAKYLPAMII